MTTYRRITSTFGVAALLAFSAGAGPASAMPHDLNASGSEIPATYTPSHVSHKTQVSQASSPVPCGDVCSGHGYGIVSTHAAIAGVSSSSGGFDWGDAGIGAAGGLALSLLGIGSIATLSQRRTRRRQTAVIS